MMQNMFQEGLYHVFFKEKPPPGPTPQTTNASSEELTNVRIHRWFGSVVNTRLLLTGVIQVLSALASILTTVSYACVRYNCSSAMVTPVWSSLSYLAAGCLAMEVQRKASNIKVNMCLCLTQLCLRTPLTFSYRSEQIIVLMALNVFSLLFGFAALLANGLASVQPAALSSFQQRAGAHVAKVSYIGFTGLCFLGTSYILFLCWRGLRRYSSRNIKAYTSVSQGEDMNALLEEQEDLNL
ncbi:transmembrane protein 253 isoform 1-T1 [Fundulus diaphanus]